MTMLPEKCVECGAQFQHDARWPRDVCSHKCKMRKHRKKLRNEVKMGLVGGSNYQFQWLNPAERSVECECLDHAGPAELPVWNFAVWETDSGRKCRATWCEQCIMRFIREHDGSDEHGQNPAADEAARLRMHEERYGGESEAEFHTEAMRLMVRRVG